MSNLLDTKALEKHILSEYNKVIPFMEKDGISMPLSIFFCENTVRDSQGEFCFADENGYHYRVIERGTLYRDDITQNFSEITYWAIEGEVAWASAIYEAKNRIPNQDFRRVMFAKRLQYLESIDPEYAQRARAEIGAILNKAPFID